MFDSKSITLSSKGGNIKVHLISTGAVKVKERFRERRWKGYAAVFDFIFDKTFTEWLPIWCMIVEHPEGIYIFDTGENANVSNPKYFKSSGLFANWFNKSQFKFEVHRNEEIDIHLATLKIDKSKIRSIVLTHLHLDHIDGLYHFENSPVYINRREWEKPYGDLPKLYPKWFSPILIDLNESFDLFNNAYYLTNAKDIIIVSTPGHTWHHCSIILRSNEGYIFFGGDMCYDQQQLTNEKYAGVNCSPTLAKDTYSIVKKFMEKYKTVFIASHDKESGNRLFNQSFWQMTNDL